MTFHVCESTISSVRNGPLHIAIGGAQWSTVRTGIINKYKVRLRCAAFARVRARERERTTMSANKLQRQFIFWEVNQANRNLFCARRFYFLRDAKLKRSTNCQMRQISAECIPKTNDVHKNAVRVEGNHFKVRNVSAFACFSVKSKEVRRLSVAS